MIELAPLETATPEPPFATGKMPVTFAVKSMLPASMAFVTFAAPIAVTPVLPTVTSPLKAVPVATFAPLPSKTCAEVNGASLVKAIAAAAAILLLSTAPAAMVAAEAPGPAAVTSPVKEVI